jgi:hypothetical protein
LKHNPARDGRNEWSGAMPREQITFTKPEIDEGVHFQYGELTVHWGPDETDPEGRVQISMNIEAEYARRRVAEDGVTHFGFLTDGLTDNEIDKLIKTLQRAKRKKRIGDVRIDPFNEFTLKRTSEMWDENTSGVLICRGREFFKDNGITDEISSSPDFPLTFNTKTLTLEGYRIVSDDNGEYMMDNAINDFVVEFDSWKISPDHTPDKYGYELVSRVGGAGK